MKIPSVKKLAESGLHFGHRESRWHPSARKYIYDSKKGVHVFDLEKTHEKLKQALERIKQAGSSDKKVLLVGTKVRVSEIVEKVGQEHNLFYVAHQWLGGMLTNFETISKNIDRLEDLEKGIEEGKFKHYTKKELGEIEQEIEEKNQIYGGIREMNGRPDLVVVMDAKIDDLAVREAVNLDIPVVALADSNVDFSEIDYPIPGNDDAIKAVELIAQSIGQAYQEGVELREKEKNNKKDQKTSTKSTDDEKK
jgi:small subunit ribosomal protein S2